MGVLVTHARRPRLWSDDEIFFLRGVANVVAAAVARERAEAARERSERRLEFLAEASHLLAASLDPEATLDELAGLIVPQMADWCVVHVLERGALVPVAVAHADPERVRWARSLQERYPTDMERSSGPANVVRTGRSELVPEVTDELLVASSRDPARLDVLRSLGMRSVMVVPLVATSSVLGSISFVWAESGGRYDESDLRFAEDLARRAALALENARAHRAEQRARERAERLQRLTALLADTRTRQQVLDAMLGEGIAASDAVRGLVTLVDSGDETVAIAAQRGYEEPSIARWASFPVDAQLPVSEAVRTQRAVYCDSIAERNERYPALAYLDQPTHALAALPLVASGRALGALVLSFAADRSFDEQEQTFLQALASQCAQALERAEIADALRRERERFEAVLRQLPSGVVIAEAPSGRLLLGNAQMEAIWRRPFLAEGIAGGGDYVGHRPDGSRYRPQDWPLARAIATGEVVVNEMVVIERGDGTRAWTSVSAAPIRDERGEIVAGVAVLSDVNEEVEARREAERRADAARALAFVADGVCLVDAAGDVRLWNPAAERITGVESERIVGGPPERVLDSWAALAAQVPTAPAGAEETARPVTLPLVLGDEDLWLSISAVSFPEGTVYAFRDVTAEQALDRMKSNFIATVSHELRTPLAAVYGAATTLRHRAALDPEEREQFLRMIEEQAQRLTRIVNEILVASRIESGELSVTLAPVDAVETARHVLEVARRSAPAGFTLELEAPPAVPPVLADGDRLRQVLGNLIENAIKYSGESTLATVSIVAVDGRVRFAVRDEGIGIPPAEHERVFERFYRVDADMHHGVSGTGLGLYIVRELVERMGGSVALESEPDRGSTFTIELAAA
jgi:signal transduction histidine kinase/GAF domain-containing protein